MVPNSTANRAFQPNAARHLRGCLFIFRRENQMAMLPMRLVVNSRSD
jgi:hypothetical protein